MPTVDHLASCSAPAPSRELGRVVKVEGEQIEFLSGHPLPPPLHFYFQPARLSINQSHIKPTPPNHCSFFSETIPPSELIHPTVYSLYHSLLHWHHLALSRFSHLLPQAQEIRSSTSLPSPQHPPVPRHRRPTHRDRITGLAIIGLASGRATIVIDYPPQTSPSQSSFTSRHSEPGR